MQQAAGNVDMSGVAPELVKPLRRAIAFDKTARPHSPLAFASRLVELTKNQ
jgi:hypothetical protein